LNIIQLFIGSAVFGWVIALEPGISYRNKQAYLTIKAPASINLEY
jgi:hypothetical protein